MSPSINRPWLFHAVVGLWCWHVCRLREKIFVELGHKPEGEGGKGVQEREMWWDISIRTMFSRPLRSHLNIQYEAFVTWPTAEQAREAQNDTTGKHLKKISYFTLSSGFPRYPWFIPHKSKTPWPPPGVYMAETKPPHPLLYCHQRTNHYDGATGNKRMTDQQWNPPQPHPNLPSNQ